MNTLASVGLVRVAVAAAILSTSIGVLAACDDSPPLPTPTTQSYPALAERPAVAPVVTSVRRAPLTPRATVAAAIPPVPPRLTALSLHSAMAAAPAMGGGAPDRSGLAPATYPNGGASSLQVSMVSLPATGRAAQTHEEERSSTESYVRLWDNPFKNPGQDPWSTFALDVDTASFSNIRRFVNQGEEPPLDAVRIEELVNYFAYADPPPTDGSPFAVTTEVNAAPWAPNHRLVRIGLKAPEVEKVDRPRANLVFLLDVSGSMWDPSKLPLVKQSLRLLTAELKPDDSVAIVVYAGAAGLVLPATAGSETETIMAAVDNLEAGGSTAGSEGIQLAYEVALANFLPSGINRVILATDGDFNVGVTSPTALVDLITEKAKLGVFLTVLGYGMGNLKDETLEGLADHGNGSYAYVDSLLEAKKVLVDELGQTLMTIAKDVKLQVEFNPETVSAYRLLGYENRLLASEDFNDDTKDGGEMGAGHSVTALYEVVPKGIEAPTPIATPATPPTPTDPIATLANGEPTPDVPEVDPLIYQGPDRRPDAAGELLTVKLRYKAPDGNVSQRVAVALTDSHGSDEPAPSSDWRFAAAVAQFGMLLRHSPHAGTATFEQVAQLAESAQDPLADPHGRRAAFIELVRQAAAVAGQQSGERSANP